MKNGLWFTRTHEWFAVMDEQVKIGIVDFSSGPFATIVEMDVANRGKIYQAS